MNPNTLKSAGSLFLVFLVTVWGSVLSVAATPPSGPSAVPSQTVKGEVIMIAGDLQVVENAAGKKEVRMIMDELAVLQDVRDETRSFDVNEGTQLEDTVTVGDRVEVLVSGDGHALSIKKTQDK